VTCADIPSKLLQTVALKNESQQPPCRGYTVIASERIPAPLLSPFAVAPFFSYYFAAPFLILFCCPPFFL